MPALPIEIVSCAGIRYDGANNKIDYTDWSWFADRYYGGWRCRVAEADLPDDPTDIDSFVLTLVASSNQSGSSNGLWTAIADGPAWSGSVTPLSEWATTHGTTAATISGATNTVPIAMANVATPVGSAIDASTNVSGYRYFSLLWKPDSTGGTAYFQVSSTSAAHVPNRPTIAATKPAPANFTAEPDTAISPSVSVGALGSHNDISCTGVSALGSGDGAGTYRKIDFYPATTGTGNRPTIFFVHGGGWNTGSKSLGISENNLTYSFAERFTGLGYNLVSVNYRTFTAQVFYAAVDRSWPMNLHDIRAAMEYVHTNASDLKVDVNKVVIGGHSAGGHLALWAALTACTDDSTEYTGLRTSATRPAGYGLTDGASPFKFDFDETGELTSTLKPIGVMLWDAPVDTYEMTTIPGAQATINGIARKILFGEVTGNSVPAATYDEPDLNHYIAGDGGTSYTTPLSASDIPPIFFMSSSVEDVVENSAGIDALETALDTLTSPTYDTSTANGVLNTAGGLTKHLVARSHANVLKDNGPNYSEATAWLGEVFSESPLPAYVGASQADALKVGTQDADALHYGATQVWP